MISYRYKVPVLLMLIVALIPTIIHNYLGATITDGKDLSKIPTKFADFISKPSKKLPIWGKEVFNTDEWVERIYRNRKFKTVRLFIARSYDHKRLYHHPELALSYGVSMSNKEMLNLTEHPGINIYFLANDDYTKQAAYVLLYDKQFIDKPILHQLSESFRLLLNPRKPITLFYASQEFPDGNKDFENTAFAEVLINAIKQFQAQTGQ